MFREKVENLLKATFNESTIETIIDFIRKKDTCVIALILFYENKGEKQKNIYRVLSCVLYYLIDNYVYIDYLLCQSKILIRISSNRISEKASLKYYLVLAFQNCYWT